MTEIEFNGPVYKTGGSLVITVPDDIVKKLNLEVGSRLRVKVEKTG